MSVDTTRTRILRSFGKYPRITDSPAYDASEEDNDPLTDDNASISGPVPSRNAHASRTRPLHPQPKTMKHHLAASVLSDSDGVDSPTYDGDVESSTISGNADTQSHTRVSALNNHYSSSTSTLSNFHVDEPTNAHIDTSPASTSELSPVDSPSGHSIFEHFNPAALTPEDVQSFVRKAIEGEASRKYKINPPPAGRPIRIYADGVYDLFHFGHALQLRQAKLSFPSVYLMVGVNSDEQVHEHKGRTVMIHAERVEAVRHCRWVDEVTPEAPWIINEAFIEKYHIDYVAHDEEPYLSAGHNDVYEMCKRLGKFIPTRRTPGVSTSDLLERIVSKYRQRDFDEKLTRMGHAELRAEGSDYDDLSRRESPAGSPVPRSLGSSRIVSPLASPGNSKSVSRSESPTKNKSQ